MQVSFDTCRSLLTLVHVYQDCVQSLEGGNANKATEVGCRFTDANGFCYHAGATQLWCKDNAKDPRCVDLGASAAIVPLGAAPAKPTSWLPVANYPLRGAAKESGETVTCACMKNCACVYKSSKWKCYCSDATTQPVGALEWHIDKELKSGKDGMCTCNCQAGPAVTVEPVAVEIADEKEGEGGGEEEGGEGGEGTVIVNGGGTVEGSVHVEEVMVAPPEIHLPPPPPVSIEDAVGAGLCDQSDKYPLQCKSLLNIR